MRWSISLLFLVSLLLPALAHAEDPDASIHKLEAIVVTATHETKAIDTPASFSIITAEELEEMGTKNVTEALSKIPGVDDASTKRSTVVIRGNKSAMAGGPVVLIDGVPHKVGDYRYDEFDFIPITQIDRIEECCVRPVSPTVPVPPAG